MAEKDASNTNISKRSLKKENDALDSPQAAKRVKTEVNFEETLIKIRDSDGETLKKYLRRLKAQLVSPEVIDEFVGEESVKTLVGVFSREVCILGTGESQPDILNYSISILGNCCHSASRTCNLMRKSNPYFLELSVRIFESASSTPEIKISLCRLIANICMRKEAVSEWISANTILLDRITLLLDSEDARIVKQALRVIRVLVVSGFTRFVVLSNGGFYLGKLLKSKEVRTEAAKILQILLKRHRKDVDRQISRSESAEALIDIFFEENGSTSQMFVVEVFSSAMCVREQMETDDFIEKLQTTDICAKNRMLAAFAQTAWGRAKLRTSGALDYLVDVLSNSKCQEERHVIISSFKHFVHDTAGMKHLSESTVFVNTVVRDVQKYVQENKVDCEPSVNIEFVRRLNHRLKVLSTDGDDASDSRDMTTRLHKDFYSMWSYESPFTSPRPTSSPTYSPSYSFPSSKASSGCSSPSSEGRSQNGVSFSLEGSGVDSGDEEEHFERQRECGDQIEKTIIEGELWLLTWQSQDDNNLQYLVRCNVVDCVISYLRSAPNPEFRAYRILRRMATLRKYVYKLIDMQFHIRILNGLCASPCRMLKYSKQCKQCDMCLERGREILREFASHVDNSYGDPHINTKFQSNDFFVRTQAAVSKIVLIKERARLVKVPALEVLFDSLTQILASPSNFEEFGDIKTYDGGPSLCSQIIGAMSTLISCQKIRQLCERDSWYFPPVLNEGICQVDAVKDTEQLKFVDSSDHVIASVPMTLACSNSHYFEGMFSSDFVEKRENIRTFEFDAGELCSNDELRLFLHYLAGCDSPCVTVTSAEQCSALLQLSDRYLCPNISTALCALNGPVRTFLTGNSLRILLPVALATNAHQSLSDTAFLTLMRFASHEQVTSSLRMIADSRMLTDTFLTKLSLFLPNRS